MGGKRSTKLRLTTAPGQAWAPRISVGEPARPFTELICKLDVASAVGVADRATVATAKALEGDRIGIGLRPRGISAWGFAGLSA
jgi:hypothetical protein